MTCQSLVIQDDPASQQTGLPWQRTVCLCSHRPCYLGHSMHLKNRRLDNQIKSDPQIQDVKITGYIFFWHSLMIIVHTSTCCQSTFFHFLYNYFLHALGVYHSFLSCLGELPGVNSSAGSNCCTCNCQSTLQAILQELKTMRKLMQFQAGTKKSALQMHPLIVTVYLTSSVVCIVLLSHTPSHPAVLLCLFKYSFSRLFNNL